jgi:hypothetical protein
MKVKYKIEFSGQAKIMFAMMAKLLPDELNVHVEEIPELKEEHFSKVAQLVNAHQKKIAAPFKKKRVGNNRNINLNKGANKIMMKLFADGKPHKPDELRPMFQEANLSINGVASALAKMKIRGILFQPEVGLWQITKGHQIVSHEK